MLLSVLDIKVQYRGQKGQVRAIDGVSLDIDEGQVIALVGESGSGKSTLALSIVNLLPPSGRFINGRVIFKNKDLITLKNSELCKVRGGEIGMVFQEPISYLNPLIRVGDQVAEALVIHEGLSKKQAALKAKDIFGKVRISDASRVYDYYPHQLSGGMAQRVGIGIAISCQPFLLIADEPTSNLDVTVQAQILHLLKGFSRELKLAILLISHDLGVVSGMADRVAIMYAGRIAEEADVQSLFKEPKHPYTQALMTAGRSSRERDFAVLEGALPDLTNLPPGCRFSPRCPYAMEQCRNDPPEIKSTPDTRVFCWLYGERG